jgi:NADH dehydrogenase
VVVSDKNWQGKTIELGGQGVHSFQVIMKKIIEWSGKKRWVISLPYFLAALMGKSLEWIMPSLLTFDQVQLLKQDNIVNKNAINVKDLRVDVVDIVDCSSAEVLGS